MPKAKKAKVSKKTTKKVISVKAGPKKVKKITTTKPAPKAKKTTKKAAKKAEVKKPRGENLVKPSQIEISKDPIPQRADRKYYSEQLDKNAHLPNLIEIQLDSYKWFVEEGIRDLLDEISPIQDFSGKKLELKFLDHEIGEVKYDAETAKAKNITYEAPLKVHVQLITKETGEIKEQDVYLGSIPLMTNRGTFIINGIERVVVSQLVRSPGVFFSENAQAPKMHNAKIIPKRGAWLEVETDKKGIIQ